MEGPWRLTIFSLLQLAVPISSLKLPGPVETFAQFDEAIKIPFKDGAKSMLVYKSEGFEDLNPMVLDEKRQELLIGSKDGVWRVRAKNLDVVERVEWPASQRDVQMCIMKGKPKEQCHNFIRTLVVHKDKVLMCGTNAYAPRCSWRKANDLKIEIGSEFDGIGKTPYNPHYKNSYVMTNDGDLYSGVVTDFNGHDSGILRVIPNTRILKTDISNNRWLNVPMFVGAFEVGNFVYFFFREAAVELVGEEWVSRVARICKNDIGGDFILQEYWTTFSKASLNCSAHGIHFSHLQSVYFDEANGVFYAIFTRSKGNLPSSAICAYDIPSIRVAFSGPFLYQKHPESSWGEEANNYRYFDCEVKGLTTSNKPGLTVRHLHEAQQYQLMSWSVQPVSDRALHHAPLETYTHIVMDAVRVKRHGIVQMLFVTTDAGLIKKFSVLPPKFRSGGQQKVCLVEVIELSESGNTPRYTDVKIMNELGGIYLTGEQEIVKVTVERCSRYGQRTACTESGDPYCGWNSKTRSCTVAPGKITSHHYWHQNLNGCPKTNLPVDGGWGKWGEWEWCPWKEEKEGCKCRQRRCDDPPPLRGGKECKGSLIQVNNCTRNGLWTQWSSWSACSASCGISLRSRSRVCGNPSPAHGGKGCEGETSEEEYCKQTACPIPTVPPVHGGWSLWTGWERCSRKCGGGMQRRKRDCNNPSPANNGSLCSGCHMEYRSCKTEPCDEVRRWTEWTPWLQANTTSNNGVWVKRYKFACKARIDDPKMLGVSRGRTEEKFCVREGGDCTDTTFLAVDGGWTGWGAWLECGEACGGGVQSRIRSCTNPPPSGSGADCPGHAKEQRECNTHSCQAIWTCWSGWGECSVSCGSGLQHRIRECKQIPGMEGCKGNTVETVSCNGGPCTNDGFGVWSGWSACSELGVKVRIRPCISETYCGHIPDAQMKRCVGTGEEATASEVKAPIQKGNLTLIFCVVGAFVGGVILTVLLTCWALRRQSNCCYLFGVKKQLTAVRPPPTPSTSKCNNIYTPPPVRNNVRNSSANLTINPLNPLLGSQKALEMTEMPDLTEQEASLTLRRTMRASLNTRDYQ